MNKTYLLTVIFALALLGCESQKSQSESMPQINADLRIEFNGRGSDISLNQKLDFNSTVLELLQSAQSTGQLKFEHRGTGETAFIHSIGGVENEAAGGSNWLFFVNDELSDQGCGIKKLTDGDVVSWRYSLGYPPE